MVEPSSPPAKEVTKIFVVGLGMVGIAFIEKMLGSPTNPARPYKIITCGEEQHLAYNRVGLTEYFQHRDVKEMLLVDEGWYGSHEQNRFEFNTNELVTKIDHENKKVISTKKSYDYDICVIATGSTASFPPYCPPSLYASTQGCFVYRSIADLEKIITFADKDYVKRAVVVGGGLLGLEAAKAVYDLPTIPDVAIINRQSYPLSRQLDSEAGEMVLHKIEEMGVQVYTNINVNEMISEDGVLKGFKCTDGTFIQADLVIFAVGISPRDDLARTSGIKVHRRGGIEVDDNLETSAKGVYAMGECASWRGNTYGLIAPGVEMASILTFNLTQTLPPLNHQPRKMNAPDLSTKLKLMGVDVASFGDFFADKGEAATKPLVETVTNHRTAIAIEGPNASTEPPIDQRDNTSTNAAGGSENGDAALKTAAGVKGKVTKHGAGWKSGDPIKCLTYKDPFGSVYKKYIFSADGKYLVGGMMVGDVSDFVKLVAITKKKKPIEMAPAQFIVGSKAGGEDDGADLDDDTQICSCHNVVKGAVAECIKEGAKTPADVKKMTKAGAGCGGCMPLVTNIFKAEMAKAGLEVSNDICVHFKKSRVDLFNIVKVKKLKTFREIMTEAGVRPDATGCEICKPVIASLISTLVGINEHIMDPVHHQNQETNDRFLANIQRDGTFSVVPRMAAGEVSPDKLIALGMVAKKYKLYTKITGGQRIDLFGARKQDLPDIWEELGAAGFESGHAYGKSLRTVKSCVGSSWCRYGVGDSVGLAVQLEERYKGIRSPHKFKGGVSGCVRECAEAQGKDFGLIATDKGWNVFIGGNGGANPKHAVLFATDVPPDKVVRVVDRYLMFYIYTADKLMRTARWLEQYEGGIEKLRKILLEDSLGICAELDAAMDRLVGTYEDEWARVVAEPERRKLFRQHVNTTEGTLNMEKREERGQPGIAEWPKDFPPIKMNTSQLPTPKSQWTWQKVAMVSDLMPTNENTTSCSVKIGESQIAIFNVPNKGMYATQQMCPHKRAFVLDHGIIGDDEQGNVYVSCPLHKRNYKLDSGDCLNDNEYSIMAFDVKSENDSLYLLLPPTEELDAELGTSKWMVRQATSEALGLGAASAAILPGGTLELVGPKEGDEGKHGCEETACGDSKLSW